MPFYVSDHTVEFRPIIDSGELIGPWQNHFHPELPPLHAFYVTDGERC
jgi:hypothetical protein